MKLEQNPTDEEKRQKILEKIEGAAKRRNKLIIPPEDDPLLEKLRQQKNEFHSL